MERKNGGENRTSLALNSKKIDQIVQWLLYDKARLEKEAKTYVWVEVIDINYKKNRGRFFYYITLKVCDESLSYLERRYNPFVIRENKSFKINFMIGSCVKCESDTNFRMVFDHDPKLESYKKYKLETIVPVNILEQQIEFMKHLKNSDCLLRDIVYGKHEPKPYDKVQFSLDPSLNSFQKEAVEKALNCKDFHLILGPPGTGKTTIIKELCRLFAAKNEKVLLTSWMNVAVDNALEAVIKNNTIDKDKISRIGAGDYKVSDDILPLTITGGKPTISTNIAKMKVVGSTLASTYKTGNYLNPPFDVVIVDEAGTSTVPQTLFALGFAKKFILIGDHLQLPPIISDDAEKWLKESLFEKLWKLYPAKHTMLRFQYRMEPSIATIASECVYSQLGGIVTDKSVLKRSTPFDKVKNTKVRNKSHQNLLKKNSSVCWVHTLGNVKWINDGGTKSASNISEIENIERVLNTLIEIGNISPDTIGVLSPFRYQVSTMTNFFEKYIDEGLVINTIHSFQGDEKSVIIISLVTDKPDRSRIYDDIRLMNVAITRSKYKIIFVGNVSMCMSQKRIATILDLSKTKARDNNGFFGNQEFRPSENTNLRAKDEEERKWAKTASEIKKLKRETLWRRY